jgi:hypothetical protein
MEGARILCRSLRDRAEIARRVCFWTVETAVEIQQNLELPAVFLEGAAAGFLKCFAQDSLRFAWLALDFLQVFDVLLKVFYAIVNGDLTAGEEVLKGDAVGASKAAGLGEG